MIEFQFENGDNPDACCSLHTIICKMVKFLSFFFSCPGYNLTPQALNIIIKRYSDSGRIKFDDFVSAAIRLRMLTGMCFMSIAVISIRSQHL